MSEYSYDQDPQDFNAADVVAYLENADLTSEQFYAVQEWERQGKARKSILRVEYTNGEEDAGTEDFDLSGLKEITPDDMAKAPRTGRTPKPNPLDPFMKRSYEEDKAFEQVLDNDRVKDFVAKVRRSAINQGLGSKVRLLDAETNEVLKSDQVAASGRTIVQFQATEKRERNTGEELPEETSTESEMAENTNYEYAQ
jgi:hypothetical protein